MIEFSYVYSCVSDDNIKLLIQESKVSVGLRNVSCVIVKKENGWWKRLLHGAGKTPPYLKADWDKWIDEDEENEIPSNNGI